MVRFALQLCATEVWIHHSRNLRRKHESYFQNARFFVSIWWKDCFRRLQWLYFFWIDDDIFWLSGDFSIPIDYFYGSAVTFSAQWRLFVNHRRLFLAYRRHFLTRQRYFMAPWRLFVAFLARRRFFLAQWRLFLSHRRLFLAHRRLFLVLVIS